MSFNLLICVIVLGQYFILIAYSTIPTLEYYENIYYNEKDIIAQQRQSRIRRHDNTESNYIYLDFHSLNKRFQLKLKKSKSLFDHDFIEINEHNRVPTNDYDFYDGYLLDEPLNSYASGTIINGVFYGTIRTSNGNYFIESSKKFTNAPISHTIIYHEDDVAINKTSLYKKRSIETHSDHYGCASDEFIDNMKEIQRDAYLKNIQYGDFDSYYTYTDHSNTEDATHSRRKYSEQSNKRQKRDTTRLYFPDNRSVCYLYLKVDPVLFREIYRNEGNQNHDLTVKFLMNYMQKHVEALNSIYSGLQFFNSQKNEYYIGLRFGIRRTKIITDDMCSSDKITSLDEAERKLCEPYLDVQTFLNYVALDNYTQFCLAYTFTARDFADGTLGLAWVAKTSGSIGGVCERRQNVQNIPKSLNSGIVTVINYQARVAEAVSYITFAHEVGHNFGAEHDIDGVCTPGDKNGGNYIMYRKATTGTQRNNRNFSQCSKDSMGAVMFSLVNSGKFCFEANKGPLCGNNIVEEGEECDCGYRDECQEQCCYPAESEQGCKLKPGKLCSPSSGPCCRNDCTFTPDGTLCFRATECMKDVMCNGFASYCPKNNSQFFVNFGDDGKLKDCNDGTQVCRDGVCMGSICEKFDMTQCYLEGDLKNKNVDKQALCHLACQGSRTKNVCTDSSSIDGLFDSKRNKSGFILKPGSACSGTQGYCDIFSKCRAVDAEGPLSRLKKFLLNPKTLTDIKTWVTDHWWAVVLIAIGVLIFMGLFIKICSVHTPSSNPNKPAALKFTDTLRRPMRRHRQPVQATTTHLSNPNLNNRKIQSKNIKLSDFAHSSSEQPTNISRQVMNLKGKVPV